MPVTVTGPLPSGWAALLSTLVPGFPPLFPRKGKTEETRQDHTANTAGSPSLSPGSANLLALNIDTQRDVFVTG